MSQNFLTNSSCRNDNLTQIRNKFDAILSDFIQNIHNAKNQVTNIKSKANSGELRNFTIWLNSFDKFLLELDEEITKFNEKIDSYNKNNYSQLNEWSHEFVAILFKKELPQDITADFENQYQQCQQLNDLLKDSISQANNNLQKILENSISENNLSENQLNQYAGTNANQPLVELLRKFEKLLLETEQDANSYIPDSKSKRNSQQEKIPNYEEIIEWLKTLLDKFNEAKQQFSNSKHIQLCVPPENIEKIYTNVIQQTDKLKIDIETFSTNSYLKGFPESQNTNYRISRYSKFTEYIKSFLSHISVSKRDLLDKIDLLVNENHDMDIDNKDENNHSTEPEYDQPSNRINASGKMISNANHKSTNYKNNFKPNASYKKYSWNRKRHDQPNYNQQIEELEKLKNENKELLEKVGDLEAQLKSGNHRIKKLMDEHKSLRVETAKYQSALGKATNFRINDHNPNSVSQLVEDIKDLKHQLDNFCSLKKVDIDYTALKELLGKYGCLSSGNKPSKNLVKGILQRHVIEMVINNVNKYLKIDNEHEKSLETSLVNKEDSLETSLDNKEDSLETSLVNKEDSLEK
ncbi:2028_t:CDS:1, partial [Racocetra fulgida]